MDCRPPPPCPGSCHRRWPDAIKEGVLEGLAGGDAVPRVEHEKALKQCDACSHTEKWGGKGHSVRVTRPAPPPATPERRGKDTSWHGSTKNHNQPEARCTFGADPGQQGLQVLRWPVRKIRGLVERQLRDARPNRFVRRAQNPARGRFGDRVMVSFRQAAHRADRGAGQRSGKTRTGGRTGNHETAVTHWNILKSWSISESPLNIGWPEAISTNTQPMLHRSTEVV